MPLDERLLEILVCPACHASIRPVDDDWLACQGCGRRYPVRDGIPVLLVEEAEPPPGGEGGSDSR